jgi:tetratricopeptide (TPR) repeat protein
VVRAYPKAVWAYTNCGLAYCSSGDQDRAIDDLDMAISLDRGYARAYAIRATAFNAKGNWDRGIVDLTKRSSSTLATPNPTATAPRPTWSRASPISRSPIPPGPSH